MDTALPAPGSRSSMMPPSLQGCHTGSPPWRRCTHSMPAISDTTTTTATGTHMLNVWYVYLHDWVIYGANVAKYTIHGSSGG